MDKKSINELKRRLKKDVSTIDKICGCYINDEKEKTLLFRENFLELEDDEYFKYLDFAKKILNTNLNNNMLNINFTQESEENGMQNLLMKIKKTALDNDDLLNIFYDKIIEKYDLPGNYIILLYHDIYDVMVKTSDNLAMDESVETYEYVICAICPMILNKPGLGYREDKNAIATLDKKWIVGMPQSGFLFPAFIDRSSDVHSALFYTSDSKDPHKEMIVDIMGCENLLTSDEKKGVLNEMVGEVVTAENASEILESVNLEFAKLSSLEENSDVVVTNEHIEDALEYAGLSNDVATSISNNYIVELKEELPNLADLVTNKAKKAVKDEDEKVMLREEIKELNRKLVETTGQGEDILIKVAEDKKSVIREEYINGEKCIVIPVSSEDTVKIN